MVTKANQYANKIYSEHPIALWPLDEQAYYISLIDDNYRRFTNWTLTGCTASDTPTLPAVPSPFDDNVYSSFTKSSSAAGLVEVEGPDAFSLLDVDIDKGTFTVNFFLYQNPTYINWFKVGFRYLDSLSAPQEEISAEIPAPQLSSWLNFNNTYDLPVSWSGDVKLFIQVDFADSSSGDAASRTLVMSGLSVGQSNNKTCYESLGLNFSSLPADTLVPLNGVVADQYGVLADSAYYVVKNNSLLAHNDALPIIYGTDNSTEIEPSGTTFPSFIFPGKGMLNESGRNKKYTFEAWVKINPVTYEAKRIIGPLGTDDGIYVKEGFITLVIGNEIGSHFVSEWYRPMLLNLSLRESNAVLTINGEQVISIPFDRSTVDLPDTRDWWGVFSYSSISYFNIDSIAIFPYVVSDIAAKRRFVYGQGTPSIQSIDDSYQGVPTTIDFSTAEYNSNIIYPDLHRWDAGYFNNLTATRDYLAVPNYTLPIIDIGGRDVSEWYESNLAVNNSEYNNTTHPRFISFRPNTVTLTNLINNPSFEVDYAGWSVGGGTGTIVADGTFGTSCLSLQPSSSSDYSSADYVFPCIPNQTYTLSADCKIQTPVTAAAAPAYMAFGVYFNRADDSFIGGSVTEEALSGAGWNRYSMTFTAPEDAEYMVVRMYADSGPNFDAGGELRLDSVLLEEGNAAHMYFDGTDYDLAYKPTGSGWSGAENGSQSYMQYWDSDGINYQENCYLNFPSLNVLNDPIAAIYGVFEINKNIAQDRPLMTFVNAITGDTFIISVNGTNITYTINNNVVSSFSQSTVDGGESLGTFELTVDGQFSNSQATETLDANQDSITYDIAIGDMIAVGVNLESVSQQFGYEVSRFFSSPSSVQLYVGGNGTDTFEGKIYSIGLCNSSNLSKIENSFADNGIALLNNAEVLLEHIASYTLLPEYEYGKFYLDISVQAEWEEYFPLTYFASYVKDANGDPTYDLDMMQINIGYPTVTSDIVWTYDDLKTEFTTPNDYADLEGSQYLTYLALNNRNITGSSIVAKSSVRSYISFQSTASGANTPLDSIPYQESLPTDGVIYADAENTIILPTKAYQTKFAFKDNTIVYPPKSQDFQDYAMVVHLQVNQRSIIKNPLKIRNLEISSKNYNYMSNSASDQRTSIGTKFGKTVYPTLNILGTSNYKDQNPLCIYKSSTPYLYNTGRGGFRVVNESNFQQQLEEGYVFIPVNESGAFNYKVSAVQLMVKPEFLDDGEKIKFIEIKHKNGLVLYALDKIGNFATISSYQKNQDAFIIDGGPATNAGWDLIIDGAYADEPFPAALYLESGTNAYAEPLSGFQYSDYAGTEFYQDGRYVRTPLLEKDNWTAIGIVFPEELDFSDVNDGGIRVYGGGVFNNVSYYLSGGLGTRTDLIVRTWQSVYDVDGTVPAGSPWSYWDGSTWQEVYVLGQDSSYISTPADIFDTYVGTNSEIIDDGMVLSFNHRQSRVITDAGWTLFSGKPA